MNENAVLVPTYLRSSRIERFLHNIMINSAMSDVYLGVEKSDNEIKTYKKIVNSINQTSKIEIIECNGTSMLESLNYMSLKLYKKYRFLTFMGDDHIVKTFRWDEILSEPIRKKFGISYPNDLIQNDKLPTAIMINSNMVGALGFFGHPIFKHLYVDNSWLEIGRGLKNINYFERVIIEHEHFSVDKAMLDQTYLKYNKDEDFRLGLDQFNQYMEKYYRKDILRLKLYEILYQTSYFLKRNFGAWYTIKKIKGSMND